MDKGFLFCDSTNFHYDIDSYDVDNISIGINIPSFAFIWIPSITFSPPSFVPTTSLARSVAESHNNTS